MENKYLVWGQGYTIRIVYNDSNEDSVKHMTVPTRKALDETMQLLELFFVETKQPDDLDDQLHHWFVNIESEVVQQKDKPEERDNVIYVMNLLINDWFNCTPNELTVEFVDVFYSQYPIYVDRLKDYEYPKTGTNQPS